MRFFYAATAVGIALLATSASASVNNSSGYVAFDNDYVTNPAVAAQAAALEYDPDRIFLFVRDEIFFESYAGILRGALGTLQGRAGNGPDQAVLLHALLRESGQDVRFVRGRLAPETATKLLTSMFTPPLLRSVQITEAETSGVVADPANDPELLAEVSDHVWVQMSTPTGWQDLDPAFRDNSAGQSRTSADATFSLPPSDWYHGFALRVRLERIAGDDLSVSYPLTYEGRVADLAGQRLSFSHVPEAVMGQTGVEAAEIGRVLSASHRRFVPVLQVGDLAVLGDGFNEAEGFDPDTPIGQIGQALGVDPAESGPISGEWLELRFTTPGGNETRLERVVFDRLGPAARARHDLKRIARTDVTELLLGTYLSLLLQPHQLPVNVAQSEVTATLEPRRLQRQPLERRLAELQAEGIEPEIRRFLEQSLLPQAVEVWFDLAHSTNQLMAAASDANLAEERRQLAVRAYPAGPRLYITHFASFGDLTAGRAALGLDLRHIPLRVLAYPGVDRAVEVAYQMLYGMVSGALEESLVQQLSGREAIGVPAIFAAAAEQDIAFVTYLPRDAADVDSLLLPADAKARLTTDLANGYAVTVPVRFVTLPATGDEPRSGWWRHDLQTGAVVAVLDNGLHAGFISWKGVVAKLVIGKTLGGGCALLSCPTQPLDIVVGFNHALAAFAGSALELADKNDDTPWNQLYADARSRTAGVVSGNFQTVMLAGLTHQMSSVWYLRGMALGVKLIGWRMQ